MAAFSYQPHPFLLDSVFLPNNPLKMSAFSEEPNTTPVFSPFYAHDSFPYDEVPVAALGSGELLSEHTCNNCTDQSSSVSDSKLEKNSDRVVTEKVITTMVKKRKRRDGFSSTSSVQSKDGGEVKGKRQRKRKGLVENDEGYKGRIDEQKVAEEAPTGYIHVRARRGQATDSHSLAERVRREKISERMKVLQTLVPGCDKVIGKALMLDEIINYVQSLQDQVEFLSMKLACMNPMFYDFGMDLDALMAAPERLDKLMSPVLRNYRPALAFASSDHAAAPSGCCPLVSHQGHRATTIPPDQVLLEVDERSQKIANQSCYIQQLVGSPLLH